MPNRDIPASGAVSFYKFHDSALTAIVGYEIIGVGGFGGSAGTRRIGSLEVVYGDVLTVSIGAGGLGSIVGYRGGDGASGYAHLTWDEKAASFAASGSLVVD